MGTWIPAIWIAGNILSPAPQAAPAGLKTHSLFCPSDPLGADRSDAVAQSADLDGYDVCVVRVRVLRALRLYRLLFGTVSVGDDQFVAVVVVCHGRPGDPPLFGDGDAALVGSIQQGDLCRVVSARARRVDIVDAVSVEAAAQRDHGNGVRALVPCIVAV